MSEGFIHKIFPTLATVSLEAEKAKDTYDPLSLGVGSIPASP